ncbi:MAG: DEAD/DEAH box helicase [Bacteroidia bacterium]|nr:DEAD/DEAH box helicase [Bacteroidia bacterium]
MRFEEYAIAGELKRSLGEFGYQKPTDIQFRAIPSILKGEDVLAIAQTGTGKTAAFAIPVLQLIHQQKKDRQAPFLRAIILAPTHELARQIHEVFQQLGKYSKVISLCLTGGVDQAPQIAALKKGVDVLIATPGRMFDLISQGFIKPDKVGILVLDEADHMLDLGFIKDIQDLTRLLPRKRQTLFFSATIDAAIKKVAYSLVHNPIRIQISPKNPVAKNIDHRVAFIGMDEKRFFLERLVHENPDSRIIAFVRTIVRAERVVAAMSRVGIEAQSIHREKEEADRMQVMENFKLGKVKLLIATDISARGIDIPNVDFVINYDLPEQAQNYVHRVGRTGRGKEKGLAISFCSPGEKPVLEEIESFLQKPILVLEIHPEDYRETLQMALDPNEDWKSLLKEAEEGEKGGKKTRKDSSNKKKARKKGK